MTTANTGEGRERELATPDDGQQGAIPADTLANRLLLARTHAGYLTVKEAAERCGLNYGSWSNWERGARPRDLLDVVRAVADGLGMDYNWLLFGGPLLPARGARVTKRPGSVTIQYRLSPPGHSAGSVRPPVARSSGRGHSRRPNAGTGDGRRANRVDAADNLSYANAG